MKLVLNFSLLLGAIGVALGGVPVAHAAVATWSHEDDFDVFMTFSDNNGPLNGASAYTLEFRFKTDAEWDPTNNGVPAWLIAIEQESQGTQIVGFELGYHTNANRIAHIFAKSGSGLPGHGWAETAESWFEDEGDHPDEFLQPDKWYTARIVVDGPAATNSVKGYLDGHLLYDYPFNGTFPAPAHDNWLLINPEVSPAFTTLVDYVRVIDSALAPTEALLAPGGVTFDAADFDENGSVGTADFNAWATNFGLASGATKAQGDADGDGNVDGGDFVKWQEQYGRGGGSFAAVPEPATALSVALMVGALVTRRRRA